MTGKFGRKKIGLLGGSFNPAHSGHLYISRKALELLDLDEVWWLISPQNPLKSTEGMAEFPRRFDSAVKVAAAEPRIVVSDIECTFQTRYTVDTIRCLKERFPDIDFVWLMGADNLIGFHRWREWRTIMRSVPIAVFARKTYRIRALHGRAANCFRLYRVPSEQADLLASMRAPAWTFLPIRVHPASATEIRNKGLF